MIIILKKQAEEAKINALKKEMEEQGLGIHESEGVNTRILGLVGDTSVVDMLANSYVIGIEIMQGLSGSLGVVLTVPITALIASFLAVRKK